MFVCCTTVITTCPMWTFWIPCLRMYVHEGGAAAYSCSAQGDYFVMRAFFLVIRLYYKINPLSRQHKPCVTAHTSRLPNAALRIILAQRPWLNNSNNEWSNVSTRTRADFKPRVTISRKEMICPLGSSAKHPRHSHAVCRTLCTNPTAKPS